MNRLPKGLAACAPGAGRSDCTSAKRNGDRDLSPSPSASQFELGFFAGVAFAFATILLIELFLRAGV